MRKLGVHISISGGIYRSLERARRMKINSLQIFLKNSNRWKAKPLTDNDISMFQAIRTELGNLSIFAHSGYLINLAGEGENFSKSLTAFEDELHRADQLNIPYLVVHPGSHKGNGLSYGIRRISQTINRIFEKRIWKVSILLETTAGQGNSIGHKFEHFRDIFEKIDYPDKIGICLDTCHIFTAGYDISNKKNCPNVISEFDRIIGLDALKLIHLNDSKKECGSRIDRHEHIGDGFIGKAGFKAFLRDKRLKHLPIILETPKYNDDEADRMNLSRVRKLL